MKLRSDEERKIVYDLLVKKRANNSNDFKQIDYDLAWRIGRELKIEGWIINKDLHCEE